MTITYRSEKGSALTYDEMDNNFRGLANGSFLDTNININVQKVTVDEIELNGQPFWKNKNSISANVTLTTDYNYMSAGPITVENTVTITIATGAVWTIV